jgi:ABC-type transport system involved in multi-copper enzyme maturation permease subunit
VGLAVVVLAGILFGLHALNSRGGGGLGVSPGRMLFEVFKWLSFLAASFSGVILTADCLSEEKREGTLGLLFLTDLRGYDVVLGKVAIHALQSVYAFLAAFPVVGTCFLLGGVTGTEFFRIIVLLMATLFLSLSIGVLVSACNRETARTMTITLAVQLFLLLGLPALDQLIGGPPLGNGIGWLIHFNPAYAIWQASAIKPSQFYNPILCLIGLATTCLAASSLIAPRTWQSTTSRRKDSPNLSTSTSTGPTHRPPLRIRRRPVLDRDPVEWLAQRLYRPGWLVWITTLVTFAGLAIAYATRKPSPAPGMPAIDATSQTVALVLSTFIRLWLALQACRFWTDARASGAMELLLVTPLQPRQIIRGQWRALCRAFIPIVLVLALITAGVAYAQVLDTLKVNRASMLSSAATLGSSLSEADIDRMLADSRSQMLVSMGFNVILQLSSFWAVAWMGMWMGMTTRRIQVAVGKTLIFADFLPMVGATLLQALLAVAGTAMWGGTRTFFTAMILVLAVALAVDLILAWIAYRRTRANFPAFVSGSSGESLGGS